jgi:hypothetical protein
MVEGGFKTEIDGADTPTLLAATVSGCFPFLIGFCLSLSLPCRCHYFAAAFRYQRNGSRLKKADVTEFENMLRHGYLPARRLGYQPAHLFRLFSGHKETLRGERLSGHNDKTGGRASKKWRQ